MNANRSQKLYVHLDMNSYFASVEQQANRTLREKPIAVCAYLHQHGCILAPSIEAKRYGVRTGMNMDEARRLAPGIIFVQVDPVKYRSTTAKIFAILHDYTDTVEHYSIDEAFMDMTGWCPDAISLIQPLTTIKQRIRDEVGDWLRCSIGVAPTRTLAKLGSDYKKPDGFTIISQETAPDILQDCNLTDIAGIGRRTHRRLERLGIRTLLDFTRYSPENILRMCGKQLFFLQQELLGHAYHTIDSENTPPKSIGHSYCVPREVFREGKTLGVFMKLVEKASRRLRKHALLTRGISVCVGFGSQRADGSFSRYGNQDHAYITLPEPASDSVSILHSALEGLNEIWNGAQPLAFLSITLCELSAPNTQTPLSRMFIDTAREKRQRLTQAIDAVCDTYGSGAIAFGSAAFLDKEAPDRIAFRTVERSPHGA